MAAPLRYLLAKAGARCAAAFYAHGGALRSDAAIVRARSRVCAHARACARARARAVLLLLLEPVVLLVPAVVFVRGPRCQQSTLCPPWFSLSALSSSCSSYFFACVLVLLLEEQRRENPHATAGTFASKIVPSPVRRAYLPKLSSQKIHHLVTNSTEQQSAHRQMARISRQAFFPSAAGLRGRGKPLQAEPAV